VSIMLGVWDHTLLVTSIGQADDDDVDTGVSVGGTKGESLA